MEELVARHDCSLLVIGFNDESFGSSVVTTKKQLKIGVMRIHVAWRMKRRTRKIFM